MGANSYIEWTDHTWNPLLGCDKCSEGCKFCYAIRTAWRLAHNPNPKIAAAYAGLVEQRADGSLNWTGKINLLPDRLRQPLSWPKPARIFVNSQSDLFHEAVPDKFIAAVFGVMAACPQHTFQVLTKRPERMAAWFKWVSTGKVPRAWCVGLAGAGAYLPGGLLHRGDLSEWPLPNVWLGTSVENQRTADERIPELLKVPARVRFLSCEPLLGPADLSNCKSPFPRHEQQDGTYSPLRGSWWPAYGVEYYQAERSHAEEDLARIDWVICGGESGPSARPMHPEWARGLRNQCAEAGVPFFFKQWGGVQKAATGRLLDGRTHDEFPTVLQP